MIALGCVLLVLLLINIAPIGVTALYDENGPAVWLKIAFLSIKAYPLREKGKKKTKKKTKKKKAGEKEPEQAAKTGGAMELLQQLFPLMRRAAAMFRKALDIDELTVYYSAASGDAAQTAMQYGALWAAVGGVASILENLFNVKNRDLRVFADFGEDAKPKIYVKATLTIRVFKLVYIAGILGIGFFKNYRKQKKYTQSEKAVR